jgi:hypothetical protein
MIIVMNATRKNEAVAAFLKGKKNESFCFFPVEPSESEKTQKNLILLDISLDSVEDVPIAKEVSQYITENFSLPSLEMIDVYLQNFNNSLPKFIIELLENLQKKAGKKIKARAFLNPEYDYTFIIPPDKATDNWKIYVLNNKTGENNNISLSNIDENKSKVLLWEGIDPEKYLNNSTHTYKV